MTNSEKIRNYALEQVGSPYVFGATADECTPALRRQRIAQYPEYADHITRNCPVLSGKATSCAGCDDENELAYDCAQLTRFAAEAAGLKMPSGATSQWNKGDWLLKGTIDQLPKDHVAFLYRRKSGSTTTMSHTGVYLGDGMVSDAREHDDGVVHKPLEDYPWTHFAILAGMDAPAELEAVVTRPTLRKGDKGNDVKALQHILNQDSRYDGLAEDGIFGRNTEASVRAFQSDHSLTADGIVGPKTWAKLDDVEADEDGEEKPEEAPVAPQEPPVVLPSDHEQDAWMTLSFEEKVENLHKRLIAAEGVLYGGDDFLMPKGGEYDG